LWLGTKNLNFWLCILPFHCIFYIVPFRACVFSTRFLLFHCAICIFIILFSTCCKILSFIMSFIKINFDYYYFTILREFFLFLLRLLRIHFSARIITDRPSPGSTTMDDVLNSLLGLQFQGTTANNARYHHHLPHQHRRGSDADESSGRNLRRRPYAASGTANV